jgi:ABC-type transporter Mla MlaB component
VSECRFAATAEGFALSGALVYATATAAYAQGLDLLKRRAATQIDVSAVESLDSAGIAVLLAWRSAARRGQVSPVIVGLPAQGQALARVGGVLDLLNA